MNKKFSKFALVFIPVLVVLSVILCFTVFSTDSNETSEYTLSFSYDDNNLTASVAGITTDERAVYLTIPSTVVKPNTEVTYTVTSIKDSAFKNKTVILRELSIPSTVTTIGASAFEGSRLYGEVTIPSTVLTIGNNAFKGCKGISSVVLPSSITSLGTGVFQNCTALQTINLDSVTSIGASAFEGCYGLYYVNIHSGITTLSNNAFKNCYALNGQIDLSGVTAIGTDVFYGCSNVKSVVVSNHSSFTFSELYSCPGIEEFLVAEGNTLYTSIDGVLYSTDTKTLLHYPQAKENTVYTVPEHVEAIGSYAFYQATGIDKLIMGENVKAIGNGAFSKSTLKETYIPDTVNRIVFDVFLGCEDLEMVILGRGLDTIGIDCFRDTPDTLQVYALNPNLDQPNDVVNFTYIDPQSCQNHIYGYVDIAPTCDSNGYNVCVACERRSYVNSLGHMGDILESYPLTCTQNEYLVVDCYRCGEVGTVILTECSGHLLTSQRVEKTASTPGYTVNFCSVCKQTFIDDYTPFAPQCADCQTEDFIVNEIVVRESSCGVGGYSFQCCAGCGSFVSGTSLPVVEHTLVTVRTVKSSCSVNGQLVEKCLVCDEYVYTPLPLAEHTHSWYSLDSQRGYQYSTCSVCGTFESSTVDYTAFAALIDKITPHASVYYSAATNARLFPIVQNFNLSLTQEEVDRNVSDLRNLLNNIDYTIGTLPALFLDNDSGVLSGKLAGYKGASISVIYRDENGVCVTEALDYDGEARMRGNSTADEVKNPFNIKFSSKVDLFGMGASKKYCLLANLFDQTLMRNGIVIEFADLLGLDNNIKYEFVEVYMDGVYCGLYMLTTAADDVDEGRIEIDEETDFVLELEAKSDGDFYISSPIFGVHTLVDAPTDDDVTDKSYRELYTAIANIDYAIYSGDYELIQQYVDVDSMAKYYILHEYMKEVDMRYDSTRFYIEDGKLYGGPVWDFDLGLGNVGDAGGNGNSHSYLRNLGSLVTEDGVSNTYTTGLWAGSRFFGNNTSWFYALKNYSPEFRQRVSELILELDTEMRVLYEDIVDEEGNVIQECVIDAINGDLPFYEARVRNFTRFDFAGKYSSMSNRKSSYKASIDFMKSFLEDRHTWMYDYYVGDYSEYWLSNSEIINNSLVSDEFKEAYKLRYEEQE